MRLVLTDDVGLSLSFVALSATFSDPFSAPFSEETLVSEEPLASDELLSDDDLSDDPLVSADDLLVSVEEALLFSDFSLSAVTVLLSVTVLSTALSVVLSAVLLSVVLSATFSLSEVAFLESLLLLLLDRPCGKLFYGFMKRINRTSTITITITTTTTTTVGRIGMRKGMRTRKGMRKGMEN